MHIADLGILAIGSRLRILSEQHMNAVKKYYKKYGFDFEPRWFPFFTLLHARPGIGVSEAATELMVSHVSINNLCKELLKKELITLTDDPNDARAKQLALSPKGRVLYTRMQPAWDALGRAMEKTYGTKGVEQALNMMAKLDETLADDSISLNLKKILSKDEVKKTLQIVPFEPENEEHCRYFAALNIEWLEEYFSVEQVDWDMFADPKATILDPGGHIVMAKVGEQIVGTGAIIKRDGGVHELAKMAVSKPYQGNGVGAAIVQELLRIAEEEGLKKLYLVSSTCLPHAVPLYRKLGFNDSELPLHSVYQRSDITLEKTLVNG